MPKPHTPTNIIIAPMRVTKNEWINMDGIA